MFHVDLKKFGLNDLSAPSMQALFTRLENDSTLLWQWMVNKIGFEVGEPVGEQSIEKFYGGETENGQNSLAMRE